MKKKELIRDLTTGKITPVLFRFAYPVMLANLLQTAYNMIDMVIVGRIVGNIGLSAVSVGGDVMHFYTFVGMGFATAGQIMISHYVGAGERKALNEVIGTLFTFVLSMGLVLSLVGVFFADVFLRSLNVPEEAYIGAYQYVVCCSIGMVFIFGYNVVSAALRGMGDSQHPMLFICLAAILNVFLDLVFISGFKMGAFGAALATVLSQGLSFILSLIYLYRNHEAFGFDFRPQSFRISRTPMQTILKLGIPITIQTSASSISMLFVGSFVNTYGVVTSAVTGVGNKLNSIALIVANALNTSGASIIGQSFAAGKSDRVKSVFYHVFCFDFIFVSVLSTCMLCFPAQIFSLFDSSSEVLAMAHSTRRSQQSLL